MKWIFYYDEAFHDRKISIKNEKINIYTRNSSDIYSGVFTGFRVEDECDIEAAYKDFEIKYKNLFTISSEAELKSTVIKRKNYKYGFASFNANTVRFYNDFFNIICNDKVILHIGMFSKTEYYIEQFLDNIEILYPQYLYSREAFVYSITKFLFTYRNDEILKNIIQIHTREEIENILRTLKYFINQVITNGSSASRKKREIAALKEIMFLLNKTRVKNNIKIDLTWDYMQVFEGYNRLLKERKINSSDILLIIDEDARTLEASLKSGNYKCKSGKSHEHIGIRISDILSHFLGAISIALDNELRENLVLNINDMTQYDFETKKILSTEWFNINQEQFELWRKIEGMFYKYQLFEWTGYNNTFCDYPILVFALLEYIWQYETYLTFKEIPLKEHSEHFNQYCIKKLSFIYERGGTPPSLG